MKKIVNIYPFSGPITTVNPCIRVAMKKVRKDTKDIRKCIIAGARVEEVLDDGRVISLNLSNYDTDNNGVVTKTYPTEKHVVTAENTSAAAPNAKVAFDNLKKQVKEEINATDAILKADNHFPTDEVPMTAAPAEPTEEEQTTLVSNTAPDLPAVEDNNAQRKLSKKERRALRRQEEEAKKATEDEETSEEEKIVETKDPEEM